MVFLQSVRRFNLASALIGGLIHFSCFGEVREPISCWRCLAQRSKYLADLVGSAVQ
jgi:hypothetical protein